MGSYLSEPVLEKHSADEIGYYMSYGSSTMQGWRVSQEDAHNNLLEYGPGKSLFAVYDGHGGHEVAEYCSQFLPDYIKQNADFLAGNYEKALEDCFIGFDATLVDRKVVEKLKEIAGTENKEEEEQEEMEINHLCEEASMPIDAVLAKYNGDSHGDSEAEPSKPQLLNPALAALKKGGESKPISPFLRAKKQTIGSSGDQSGTSSIAPQTNKHIRFDEDGTEVVQENGVSPSSAVVKSEDNDKATTKDQESVTTVNGTSNTDKEKSESGPAAAAAVTENGIKDESASGGGGSPDGCVAEKENKDTNSANNGDTKSESVLEADLKGKGKGKGKGKSSRSNGVHIVAENHQLQAKGNKKRKTANEIYADLLNDPESDDEDSEDSEDGEFGADIDSDDSDDEVDGEVAEESDEDVEDEFDEEDEDSNLEDEEEDEEGVIGADFTEEPGNDSGCTAVLALIAGTKLYVANAGDSRCVVCRDGKALEMSADHKPEDEIEFNRIKTAGGKVTSDGRVNGGLNLSRAIGDHAYKQNKTLPLKDQMISSQPDVKVIDLNPSEDSWMILACDGIWNSMTSQEVVDFVNQRIDDEKNKELSSVCEQLFEHCLASDTMGDGTGCDNMTAVIVKFNQPLGQNKDVISPLPAVTDAGSGSSSSSSTCGSVSGGGSSSSSGAGSSSSSSSNTASSSSKQASSQKAGPTTESDALPVADQAKTSTVDKSSATAAATATTDATHGTSSKRSSDQVEVLSEAPSGKKQKLDD